MISSIFMAYACALDIGARGVLVEAASQSVLLCRTLRRVARVGVATRLRTAPRHREVRGRERILRGLAVAGDLFGSTVRGLVRDLIAEEVVEHFGAGVRLVAELGERLGADRAGVGLAPAEPAHVRDHGSGSRD